MQNDQTTVTANDNEFDLDDLLLTAVQEQDIRAGRDLTSAPAPPQPCPGCGWGPPVTNHNETVAEDDATEAEALADLPVEEADQIKGGPGGSGGGGAGKVHFSDLHFTTKV